MPWRIRRVRKVVTLAKFHIERAASLYARRTRPSQPQVSWAIWAMLRKEKTTTREKFKRTSGWKISSCPTASSLRLATLTIRTVSSNQARIGTQRWLPPRIQPQKLTSLVLLSTSAEQLKATLIAICKVTTSSSGSRRLTSKCKVRVSSIRIRWNSTA